jgi:hypothetical protein
MGHGPLLRWAHSSSSFVTALRERLGHSRSGRPGTTRAQSLRMGGCAPIAQALVNPDLMRARKDSQDPGCTAGTLLSPGGAQDRQAGGGPACRLGTHMRLKHSLPPYLDAGPILVTRPAWRLDFRGYIQRPPGVADRCIAE